MQDCSTSVTSDDASEWAILSSLQAANVGYWKVVNSPVSKQQVSKLTDFSPNIKKTITFFGVLQYILVRSGSTAVAVEANICGALYVPNYVRTARVVIYSAS